MATASPNSAGPDAQTAWRSRINDVAARQIPFAAARALNQVADLAQLRQRAEQQKKFTFGRASSRAFFDRAVVIRTQDRATKATQAVTIRIAGPVSDPERGNVVARFETAGFDGPYKGRFVAMPGREARSGRGGGVKRGYELAKFGPFVHATRRWEIRHAGGLGGTKRHTYAALSERLIGKQDTWLVTLRKGKARGLRAVLQRDGKQGVRLLWLFTPRVRRPDLIDFAPTVQTVAAKALPVVFRGELAKALASATYASPKFAMGAAATVAA